MKMQKSQIPQAIFTLAVGMGLINGIVYHIDKSVYEKAAQERPQYHAECDNAQLIGHYGTTSEDACFWVPSHVKIIAEGGKWGTSYYAHFDPPQNDANTVLIGSDIYTQLSSKSHWDSSRAQGSCIVLKWRGRIVMLYSHGEAIPTAGNPDYDAKGISAGFVQFLGVSAVICGFAALIFGVLWFWQAKTAFDRGVR